jgi:glycosyltransferase involved in cell wall biosynthesis
MRATRSPRLCVVVHADYPSDVRVARQVRAAVADGFEVEVIALRGEGEPAEEVVDGALVRRLRVTHRRGVSPARLFGEYVGFGLRVFGRLTRGAFTRRPDVIQIHNPPDFLVWAALVPWLVRVPVVFDVHDLSPDMFAMRFEHRRGARAADRLLRFVERVATAMARSVITVHEPYRRELIARGVPAEKTSVVMNSIDESLLPASEANSGLEFRAVYHGTVTPHYGVGLAVEAMAGLRTGDRPALLEIFGTGDAIGDLRARARELGLDDVIRINDRYLEQHEVLRRIAGASAGIVPNLPTRLNRFALSTKLFEYIALGIPAVCSDLPTLREYFGPDEVLFFAAGDADALRAALETTANDPEAAQARADAARRRAERYTWQANRMLYVEILRSAVHRQRRSAAA